MAGIMILAVGIFGLGKIINFIPAPVITGFTSGIALTIAIGQIDNFLGIKTPAHDRSSDKLIGYFSGSLPAVNWRSIGAGLIVAGVMLIVPHVYKHAQKIPTALVGVILATAVSWGFGWNVKTIGAIPRGIMLDERLTLRASDVASCQPSAGAGVHDRAARGHRKSSLRRRRGPHDETKTGG